MNGERISIKKKTILAGVMALAGISALVLAMQFFSLWASGDVETSLAASEKRPVTEWKESEPEEPFTGSPIQSLFNAFGRRSADQGIQSMSYRQLSDSIKAYLEDKEGTYAIHFMALTGRGRFGIGDLEPMIAASTTKVPINLYLFNLFAKGVMDPEWELEYCEEDYEEGTGSIQYEDYGTLYTIRELVRRSIVESDNVAINMLVRFAGWNEVKVFMEKSVGHEVDFAGNSFSAKDMAVFMKAVYDFRNAHPDLGEEFLNYLEHTEFNDRIPLYLPEGTIVAHKIGTEINVINDVAIIFADRSYILSILSNGVVEEQAIEVLAEISRMVYENVEN